MKTIKSFFSFLKEWAMIIAQFIRAYFMTANQKALEIVALRSQLSLYQQQVENKKIVKPRCTPSFRQLWVMLSKLHSSWKADIVLVKPETVIRWHKTAFKFYWRKKSKKIGRPKISKETIDLIMNICAQNPNMSAEKIHELLISMGVTDVPCGYTGAAEPPVRYGRSHHSGPTEPPILVKYSAFDRDHKLLSWRGLWQDQYFQY